MSNEGSPPKYCLHKASGQAIVYVNGRAIYLGKYKSAASRENYNRLIAEWSTTGVLPEAKEALTVNELMLAYIKHSKKYYRKNGEPTSEHALIVEVCRALKPLYGRSYARNFGPLALKAVRETLVDSGLCRKTVNRQVGRLVRMFRWAAAQELVPSDIPQALSMVSGLRKGRTKARETAPIEPVPEVIVDATLPFLPAVVADMVRFQRLTGCRPAEVCKLRPCDLNREKATWVYRPDSHKTEHHERDRIIYVGPKAQKILLHYLARDNQMCCFRPCDSEEKRRAAANSARKTPISCGNTRGSNVKRAPKRKAGQRYTSNSYRQSIHRACDRANIDRWSPNRLRHAAATDIRRLYGLEAAQIILGHASADVTQVYAERDAKLGARIAREIG
jgi:integrase